MYPINVKSVKIVGFTTFQEPQTIEFPSSGVCLITGPNGSGKSSVIEAISVALWGKSIRGSNLWRSDIKHGELVVETYSGHTIKRVRKGATYTVQFTSGDLKQSFSKIQAAEQFAKHLFGSQEVWRRVSVFSSQDASHFTLASDAERKRILENLLGIERFEVALKRCVQDLKAAKKQQVSVHNALRDANLHLSKLIGQHDALHRTLKRLQSPQSVKSLEAELQKISAELETSNSELEKLREEERNEQIQLAELRKELSLATTQYKRLSANVCPTCGQRIPAELRERLAKELSEKKHAVQELQDTVNGLATERYEKLAKLRTQIKDLESRKVKLMSSIQKLRDEEDYKARLKQDLRETERELEKHKIRYRELESEFKTVSETCQLLEAAKYLLGPQGIRAVLLQECIQSIESIANYWIGKLSDDAISIRIHSHIVTKSGTERDKIEIELLGAGGGYGYKGASGGERRRIDVGLLFALSYVSASAFGYIPGTLFADECFDTLDPEGVVRLADAIKEIASDRAVVIVTHNERLADVLEPEYAYRVDNGYIMDL